MGSDLKRDAVAGFRWLGTASLLAAVVQFVQLALLGRLLGPGAFGLMAMAVVFIGLAAAFTEAGVPQYAIHKRDLTAEDLGSLYWVNLATAGAMYIVVFLIAPWIAAGFGNPDLVSVLRVAALALIVAAFATLYRAICQKRRDFRRIAYVDVTGTVASAAVSIGAALAGMGVWALVWGFLAGSVTQTAAYLWLGRHLGIAVTPVFRAASVRAYLTFGPFQVGSVVLGFLRSRVDQLVIGFVLGAGPLGYYNMAFTLVMQPVQKINPVLNRVALPLFSEIQDDQRRLRNAYLRLLGLLTLVNAPILLGAAAVAPVAVPLVFGPAWMPMVPLMQLLAVYALLRSVSNTGGNLVLAKGRADWAFRWNVSVFTVTPVILYLVARTGSVVAVTLALSLLQVPLTILYYRFLLRPLLGPSLRPWAGAVLAPVIMGSAMAGVVAALPVALRTAPTVVLLATQVAAGALIYTALVFVFRRPQVGDVVALLRGG
jgi:O-antigen/teichoic acid export membrane protein